MSRRPATYRPVFIADGVRSSAHRTPHKIALQEGEKSLTYAQLVARIDRVANGVRYGSHLEQGAHTAILAPNCLEFVEVVLGLASAGVPARDG